MTRKEKKEKMIEINNTLKDIFRSDIKDENNFNDFSLKYLDLDVIKVIVHNWYIHRELMIFMSEEGKEIDEFLMVHELKF